MSSTQIQGLDNVKSKLAKLSSLINGSGMQEIMRDIGEKIKLDIEMSFENEKSPFGEVWRVRKAVGKDYNNNNNRKLLHEKGNLSSNWQTKATPKQVTVSNNTVKAYGAVQNWGSKKSSGRGSGIPARRYLPIDDNGELEPKLKKSIEKIVVDKIEKVLN
ncbi:Conserved hypothetical protein, putative phage virion morphogenesis protein [Sulfurovum sp. enrichment culture clone C5]|uniref:Phage virion morphogenesis protein n=1 Tax=Sulfurovum sp. enrichment culture clone C5 TaxID=497650 RepID=A0A0S4XN88_9BACT|nr:Conserved hypothetical protein, putative phage virion morphogenesis protein [Sulfurovum sp. enrichment culture clone C5]